jgi:hypothetical protein
MEASLGALKFSSILTLALRTVFGTMQDFEKQRVSYRKHAVKFVSSPTVSKNT